MSVFFWTDGHLGWTFFALVVFSLVGLLVTDVTWRLVNMRSWLMMSFALTVGVIGVLVILL